MKNKIKNFITNNKDEIIIAGVFIISVIAAGIVGAKVTEYTLNVALTDACINGTTVEKIPKNSCLKYIIACSTEAISKD